MQYITRELENTFLEADRSFKAVLVTGARQVGKSTMLQHLAKGQGRTYVTLDHQADRELARRDPDLFFQTYPPPVLIDEVQKAPELFEPIKLRCDETEQNGLFWLTGSQSKRLTGQAGESLAGRVAILKMYGLSQREKAGITDAGKIDFSYSALVERAKRFPRNNIHEVSRHIWRGGLPDAQNKSERMLATYYESYINTYLMRDATEDNGIRDDTSFYRFLRACAAFTGNLLNYSDLATAAGVSVATAKEWVSVLQNMGIVFLLEPYHNNALKRLVKTPKLYFCDTGLCAYLSMWPDERTLMTGAASGHYYETYAVMELVSHFSYHSIRTGFSFYRDRDGKEIDMIVEDAAQSTLLEMKKTANPDLREVKKFASLQNKDPGMQYGGIICMCEKPYPIDERNCLIPGNLI